MLYIVAFGPPSGGGGDKVARACYWVKIPWIPWQYLI